MHVCWKKVNNINEMLRTIKYLTAKVHYLRELVYFLNPLLYNNHINIEGHVI